ncbi:52 kDa repressor of the inhibitor of the protein kinase-like [Solenopsis invicta]|uniref:52 kDa repressor of the inhibitor of the protein kinase-like n=1 Tax=Solenopsis invicta TaxID=13686 RepID=UPI000E340157|nr:52 kDa repressor of the inhibitor of the protein kinase-like [Solenopsis invicta]XP_039310146.1 52 kDa repressor of the inhibitor of the protein kinase-like [Solenopsis invicta]XP_039310320.1 52 kDa repressor of the inhibitor of the protein kinase-like [Solenopsis invicta]XP_039310985.1 52 kDa repressor of the inhibitor of the protein kinase-like [Solenopsis invicta]
MSEKSVKKCSIRGCPGNLKKGRHVFKFPKEYDRWLQWVHLSGRLDLEEKGPEYSFRNCRLCRLHFEKKCFKVNKKRILLQPDAIPTRFGKDLQESSTKIIDVETDAEAEKDAVCMNEGESIQEQTSFTTEEEEEGNKTDNNIEKEMDFEIVKPSTSNTFCKIMMSKATMTSKRKNSPTKEQLRTRIEKLKLKNKVLQQKLRRLEKKQKIITKGSRRNEKDEH